MAHAFVSMVIKKLEDAAALKVMNELGEEVYLVGNARAELEKLSSTFESIQSVLNHAEIMQFKDESIRVWFKELKGVAYDVEDILDEMIQWPEPGSGTNDGDHRHMGNQAWACLFSLFSCFGLPDWIRLAHESCTDNGSIGHKVRTFISKVMSQRDFAHRIKEVRAKLDQIAANKSTFSFPPTNHSSGGASELYKTDFQTSSLVDESHMRGRDEDKNIIVSKLISGSSSEEGRIHVISIVGVGGLGKTTLAQLICNDERVTRHFGKQVLWVCVSDDFNVINLTKAITKAAGGTSPPDSQLDSLQKQLMETLQDKLFLLVLDDVWNDDRERWKKLWLSLQTGAPGCKILVTTRSENVAITCRCSESAYIHKLKGLSDDDCWSLFSSRAFAERKMEDSLKEIGKEIVNKCKGVPLSVNVIREVMRSKETAEDWRDILESEIWEIPEIAEGILPALLLSYYNLPVHLKPCFAYCSLFPKDHVMEKDKLVKLWLAQGFIKPQGRREMEAIGEEYFNDLLKWSLLQDADVDNGVTKYKMHDVLHDLIKFITKNECCIFENGKTDISSITVRHSSFIATWETSHIPAPLCHAKKLRTLLQIGNSVINTIPDNLFQCARTLRALDLGVIGTSMFNSLTSKASIKELPSSIGLLKHLRYLDLSYSDIVELPESVSSLRNLQTLKLNGCACLQILPNGMSAMTCLRDLEIKDTGELKYLPKGLGGISSLRTLSRFMVGGDGGCKIGELKLLNSLQGNLVIQNLERVGSGEEAMKAKLYKKLHLRVLFLQMSRDDNFEMSVDDVERMDDVLEALQPPHINLKKLEIERCIGSKFPTWMEDLPFSNLVDLRLKDCYKCKQLPGLGRLPSLKFLLIEGGLIKRVGHEFYGNSCGGGINREAFPKLEELEFSDMYELEDWELRLEDKEIMTSLQSLTISKCPKLKALPTYLPKSLTSLKIQECSEISGILSMPLPSLQSLKTFQISYLGNMTSLPDGWEQLESLERVTISHCSRLRSLPGKLGQLKSLRSLEINDCPELQSLPQGLQGLISLLILDSSGILSRPLPKLPSLKKFQISNIDNIRSLPDGWKQLESLESLTIKYCYKLRSLPNDLVQLKSFRSLEINYCPELQSLPQGLQALISLRILSSSGILSRPLPKLPSLKTFDVSSFENMISLPYGWKQLESLETLTISDCYKLRSLPDELGQLKSLRSLEIHHCPELLSLPRGLRGLTSLKIKYSRKLAEKCREEDWSISDIQNIEIY
ncbi:putative disease resistance protein RGA3 [Magnolia sinica]|uniref:putative disease resistance protein RGA3 n=1 Tax=Magnolia sinica TaxID=86752 RepID=UPI00265B5933|nr:putative disease resistance protein RGA3 [Magnolia sinica]